MKVYGFRDLQVWQQGKSLTIKIYVLTKTFPREEQFGLVSQMRRAAVSIPSNIAEGFNRYYSKEYKRFLFVALGSCAELETQIEIAKALNYIDVDSCKELLNLLDHESRMLKNLIKKMSREC